MKHSFLLGAIFCSLIMMTSCNGGNKNNDFDDDNDDNAQQIELIEFDNEFNARRDACAERLKVIRALEESYKLTYGIYCGSFDTLICRLMNENDLRYVKEEFDTAAIEKAGLTFQEVLNMTYDVQIEKKFVIKKQFYVNPISELRKNKDNKDMMVRDPKSGKERPITDEEILNCRYVPGFGKSKEFNLVAKQNNSIWVFMAWVDFAELYNDLDSDLLENRIAAINEKNNLGNGSSAACWRVGDLTKPETRGNFE